MKIKHIIITAVAMLMAACGNTPTNETTVAKAPKIYPDYNGVTIPVGIAPMNFDIIGGADRIDLTITGTKGGTLHTNADNVDIDIDEWHQLVKQNQGAQLNFSLAIKRNGQWTRYATFPMYVSDAPLNDWGLTYRRIAPSYVNYNHMGIYQRCLANFEETPILENTADPGSCINCHTANRTNPQQFTFHVRGPHGATLIQQNGQREWLNTATDSTLAACVYPYWHPSGKYVAFSTNVTRQDFHSIKGERIEVLDLKSDLQVYCPKTHQLLLSPLLRTDDFETYPAFSPDGKWLYFCSARYKKIPMQYKDIRYNLCRIAFDANTGTFGNKVDTIFNAAAQGLSATLPRPSYDGRYIMFTTAKDGCFPIWHNESDLWLLRLDSLTATPMKQVNSQRAESFHNWSLNSRWFVFTSRRGDGLYTNLYIASIDRNGRPTKPFLLPQRHPWSYYDNLRTSYNTPDFTAAPVQFDARMAAKEIRSNVRKNITVRKTNNKNITNNKK